MGCIICEMWGVAIKFEGWREISHKCGRWCGQVEDGAEAMRWHDDERDKAAAQHAKVADAIRAFDAYAGAREGGRHAKRRLKFGDGN